MFKIKKDSVSDNFFTMKFQRLFTALHYHWNDFLLFQQCASLIS